MKSNFLKGENCSLLLHISDHLFCKVFYHMYICDLICDIMVRFWKFIFLYHCVICTKSFVPLLISSYEYVLSYKDR